MSNLVLYAIPAFLALLFLELAWARRNANDPSIKGYEARDTLASLSMGIGNVAINAVTKLGAVALFAWGYQHSRWDLSKVWWAWPLLFFAEDLSYYWFHRAHHQVRVLWAAHVNHHSSQHYNLSTALRQPWLTPFTGPWFWLPLALMGFPPAMILTAQAVSLLYQFWLHTEAVDRMGPLEWVLNTPSHHRVHHGTNPEYLDKNHGGILIIWDRLFGTFAAEKAPVRYGLTTNLTSFHPVVIAFHEVLAMARDLRRARSVGEIAGYLFRNPQWRPAPRP